MPCSGAVVQWWCCGGGAVVVLWWWCCGGGAVVVVLWWCVCCLSLPCCRWYGGGGAVVAHHPPTLADMHHACFHWHWWAVTPPRPQSLNIGKVWWYVTTKNPTMSGGVEDGGVLCYAVFSIFATACTVDGFTLCLSASERTLYNFPGLSIFAFSLRSSTSPGFVRS